MKAAATITTANSRHYQGLIVKLIFPGEGAGLIPVKRSFPAIELSDRHHVLAHFQAFPVFTLSIGHGKYLMRMNFPCICKNYKVMVIFYSVYDRMFLTLIFPVLRVSCKCRKIAHFM